MQLTYHVLDVFTDTRFGGNPLAVVLDADGLDAHRMQTVAREFNLSETVFVLKPHNPAHTARVRIFTPASELPFAGHPTVGAAALLTEIARRDQSSCTARRRTGGSRGGDRHRAGGRTPAIRSARPMPSSPLPSSPPRPDRWCHPSGSPQPWD